MGNVITVVNVDIEARIVERSRITKTRDQMDGKERITSMERRRLTVVMRE